MSCQEYAESDQNGYKLHTMNSAAYQAARRASLRAQAARSAKHGFLDTYDRLWCRCDPCSTRKGIWKRARKNVDNENAEELHERRLRAVSMVLGCQDANS